jgi:peroxiredoxin
MNKNTRSNHTTALFVCVASALMAIAMTGTAIAAPQVGKPAPGFGLPDSYGKQHTLAQYRGSFVVLEWTNHECPFVRKHYDSSNMQTLQKESTSDGVVWLSVISSAPGRQGHVTPDEANALTRDRLASPSAVLLDSQGTVGKLYGARTTPHMYIVDPEGTLIYMGGIDDKPSTRRSDIDTARNYVRLALAEAMDGKPVSDAVTRPYGCSVKYAD